MGTIIDLTTLFPWRIIMLFAYSFAYFNIAHALLKDKIHPIATLSAIFFLRVFLSVGLFKNESLNVLGFPLFFILSFIAIYLLTNGTIINKVIVSLFYLLSHILTTIILLTTFGLIFEGKPYEDFFIKNSPNLDYLYLYLIKAIVYISFSYLFAGILKLFASKKSRQDSKPIYTLMSFFPVSHIFTLVIALFFGSNVDSQEVNLGIAANTLFYILIGAIFLFDCCFPFIADHLEKTEYSLSESKKELFKINLKYEQTKLLKDEIQEIKKIKHDYLNIITTAKGLIEIGEVEKALLLLRRTNDDLITSNGFNVSVNDTINTILYIKSKEAKENNINLSFDIKEDSALRIDDYSLCRVLNNILDNALNGASESENKKVKISLIISNDIFSIECFNSYSKNPKKSNIKSKSDHGYGISIMKDFVKPYNGKYEQKSTADMFFSKITMCNRPSI